MKTCIQQLIKRIWHGSCGERGMTLVETLVALAILGVSVTAFILALSTGTIATRTLEEDALVQGLAQTQMETIKAAVYAASYTPMSAPSGYSIAVSASSSLYGDSNIQKVTVAVSYSGSTLWTLEGYKVNR
jgi:prepilin-type N-terminal cleavage/methylation domain-containing protein